MNERQKDVSPLSPAPASRTATDMRVAPSVAWNYRPYISRMVDTPAATTWVQIDLGSSQHIGAVILYPFARPHSFAGNGFPTRFRIECSEEPQFATKTTIVDLSAVDYPHPGDRVVQFTPNNAIGRYVRLTATRLSAVEPPINLPAAVREAERALLGKYFFALSKIEIFSDEIDVALQRPVTVDPALGNPSDAQQLTRARRPHGEGLITDNPQDVTLPDTWKPVPFVAQSPRSGVEVRDGLFKSALENNIRYLLDSYSLDDLLRNFHQRAGMPCSGKSTKTGKWSHLWEDDLAGSNAGRFLMGAANTLRWLPHVQLHSRMNEVVDGIAECSQPNGYIMAYPEDTIFYSERGSYTRAWVTHGLIDAGHSGNEKAFELLRGYYDWYNGMPYLPEVLRGCFLGPQGTVANTRMYFTPVGKPQDLQIVQRYLQEGWWLDALASKDPEALWQYPYDRPHCYLITFLEPYLDLYRATGDERYLRAVQGAWDLFKDNWKSIGGGFSIMEWRVCPPKAAPLYERCGETCGSAFWILVNQRLHQLQPDEEKYVSEIEQAIYNVLLANQVGGDGIRYHTMLIGQKEKPTAENTCCEGQGCRILGSLPEYIYSVAADGVYVNLFERSSITWQRAGDEMQLEMDTDFPKDPKVCISVRTSRPIRACIRIRVPSWAKGLMEIRVNGERAATGMPGSYVALERAWSTGDTVSFVLPMAFKLTKYAGVDQVAGRDRYSLEFGPLLMAAVGAADVALVLRFGAKPTEFVDRLTPVADKPLHFSTPFMDTVWMPYFEITDECFSCAPFVEATATVG